jgi:hypothetical protein
MAIIAKDSGGKDFEPLPEGGHAAICDMMVDLGLQETHFGPKHKVYLRFQVPAERVQWEKFNAEDVRGFDITKVAGAPGFINIIHDDDNSEGRTYANIASIMPIPKGMDKPRMEGELLVYEDGDPNNVFDKLPEWLQKKIKDQVIDRELEMTARPQQAAFDTDLDDDVPF